MPHEGIEGTLKNSAKHDGPAVSDCCRGSRAAPPNDCQGHSPVPFNEWPFRDSPLNGRAAQKSCKRPLR